MKRLLALVLLVSAESALASPASDVQTAEFREHLFRQSRLSLSPSIAGRSRSLQAASLPQLIEWTAPVSKSAPSHYGNDFLTYWKASNTHGQRSGKTLEAVLAWRANQHHLRQGIPTRFLVTAAEGFHSHAADLVEIGADGAEVSRFQLKLRLNLRSASRYLADPRYEGMTLLTTREGHARVGKELAAKEVNALRRGIDLDPKWQLVRDALSSDRLPNKFAARRLPTLRGVDRYAYKSARAQFIAHASQGVTKGSTISRIGGRTFLVADLTLTAYLQNKDYWRFNAGEIDGGYFAAKSSLRLLQAGLATYSLFSPEPFSKGLTAAMAVVLIGADVGLEVVQHRRENAARAILNDIDREERFQAARAHLFTAETSL